MKQALHLSSLRDDSTTPVALKKWEGAASPGGWLGPLLQNAMWHQELHRRVWLGDAIGCRHILALKVDSYWACKIETPRQKNLDCVWRRLGWKLPNSNHDNFVPLQLVEGCRCQSGHVSLKSQQPSMNGSVPYNGNLPDQFGRCGGSQCPRPTDREYHFNILGRWWATHIFFGARERAVNHSKRMESGP